MDTIPENIRAAAEAAGLGEVRSRYRSTRRWWPIVVGVLSLVGPAVLITRPFNDDNGDLVIGLGLVATCVLLWADLLRRMHGGVYWCEHGILMPDRRREPRSFRWDDVAHVWPWEVRGYESVCFTPVYTHGCDVELADGSRIRFDEAYVGAKADLLTDKVEAALTKLVFQRRLRQVRAEGRGEFGPITVEPTGLRTRSRVVGWEDIAVMEVGSTRLRVRDRDHHVRLAAWVKPIPDLDVLFQILIDHGITVRHMPVDE